MTQTGSPGWGKCCSLLLFTRSDSCMWPERIMPRESSVNKDKLMNFSAISHLKLQRNKFIRINYRWIHISIWADSPNPIRLSHLVREIISKIEYLYVFLYTRITNQNLENPASTHIPKYFRHLYFSHYHVYQLAENYQNCRTWQAPTSDKQPSLTNIREWRVRNRKRESLLSYCTNFKLEVPGFPCQNKKPNLKMWP